MVECRSRERAFCSQQTAKPNRIEGIQVAIDAAGQKTAVEERSLNKRGVMVSVAEYEARNTVQQRLLHTITFGAVDEEREEEESKEVISRHVQRVRDIIVDKERPLSELMEQSNESGSWKKMSERAAQFSIRDNDTPQVVIERERSARLMPLADISFNRVPSFSSTKQPALAAIS